MLNAQPKSLAREGVNHVADKPFEGLVLHELLVNLGVIRQEMLHHLGERLVVRHACGMRRVFLRVLVCLIGGDFGGDVVSDALRYPVGVGEQGAELLIERLEDIAQAVDLGLGSVSGCIGRHRPLPPSVPVEP